MSEEEKLRKENEELKKKLRKAWDIIYKLHDRVMGLKADRNQLNYPGHLTPPEASDEEIPSEDSF